MKKRDIRTFCAIFSHISHTVKITNFTLHLYLLNYISEAFVKSFITLVETLNSQFCYNQSFIQRVISTDMITEIAA